MSTEADISDAGWGELNTLTPEALKVTLTNGGFDEEAQLAVSEQLSQRFGVSTQKPVEQQEAPVEQQVTPVEQEAQVTPVEQEAQVTPVEQDPVEALIEQQVDAGVQGDVTGKDDLETEPELLDELQDFSALGTLPQEDLSRYKPIPLTPQAQLAKIEATEMSLLSLPKSVWAYFSDTTYDEVQAKQIEFNAYAVDKLRTLGVNGVRMATENEKVVPSGGLEFERGPEVDQSEGLNFRKGVLVGDGGLTIVGPNQIVYLNEDGQYQELTSSWTETFLANENSVYGGALAMALPPGTGLVASGVVSASGAAVGGVIDAYKSLKATLVAGEDMSYQKLATSAARQGVDSTLFDLSLFLGMRSMGWVGAAAGSPPIVKMAASSIQSAKKQAGKVLDWLSVKGRQYEKAINGILEDTNLTLDQAVEVVSNFHANTGIVSTGSKEKDIARALLFLKTAELGPKLSDAAKVSKFESREVKRHIKDLTLEADETLSSIGSVSQEVIVGTQNAKRVAGHDIGVLKQISNDLVDPKYRFDYDELGLDAILDGIDSSAKRNIHNDHTRAALQDTLASIRMRGVDVDGQIEAVGAVEGQLKSLIDAPSELKQLTKETKSQAKLDAVSSAKVITDETVALKRQLRPATESEAKVINAKIRKLKGTENVDARAELRRELKGPATKSEATEIRNEIKSLTERAQSSKAQVKFDTATTNEISEGALTRLKGFRESAVDTLRESKESITSSDTGNRFRKFSNLLELSSELKALDRNAKVKGGKLDLVKSKDGVSGNLQTVTKSLVDKVDAEIQRAAKAHMVEGELWYERYTKANTEYAIRVKAVESDMQKALLGNQDHDTVVRQFSSVLKKNDGTFRRAMDSLPPEVEERAERAMQKLALEQSTFKVAGFPTLDITRLHTELDKLPVRSKAAKAYGRLTKQIAEVVTDQPEVMRLLNGSSLPSDKFTGLATNPVSIVKLKLINTTFGWLTRLAPTQGSKTRAGVRLLADVLDAPLDAKNLKTLLREVDDKGVEESLKNQVQELAVSRRAYGEKNDYVGRGFVYSTKNAGKRPVVAGLTKYSNTEELAKTSSKGGTIYSKEVVPRLLATQAQVEAITNRPFKLTDMNDPVVRGRLQKDGILGVTIKNDSYLY